MCMFVCMYVCNGVSFLVIYVDKIQNAVTKDSIRGSCAYVICISLCMCVCVCVCAKQGRSFFSNKLQNAVTTDSIRGSCSCVICTCVCVCVCVCVKQGYCFFSYKLQNVGTKVSIRGPCTYVCTHVCIYVMCMYGQGSISASVYLICTMIGGRFHGFLNGFFCSKLFMKTVENRLKTLKHGASQNTFF
jgi:hypothetical protein